MPSTDVANNFKDAAISAALKQDWKKAIRLNTELLKEDHNNLNVLNRLGFAYLQNGQFSQARKKFQKVIKIDPYNPIATRNLKKLSTLKRKNLQKNKGQSLSPLMFLEDPGKTKIAICINLAPAGTLSTLCAGQEVILRAKKHSVEIRDNKNNYLGALPDDLSYKLIKFLSGGNRYQVLIKGVAKNSLTVFLREISRGKHFQNQPSFIIPGGYLPSVHIRSVEVPDMTPTGEEEPSEHRE